MQLFYTNDYRTTISNSNAWECYSEKYRSGQAENDIVPGVLFIEENYGDTSYVTTARLSVFKNRLTVSPDKPIIKVALRLTAKPGAKGIISILNKQYDSCAGALDIDVTALYNERNNIDIDILPAPNEQNAECEVEFYTSGEFAPHIVIYHKPQNVYRSFVLSDDVRLHDNIFDDNAGQQCTIWQFSDIAAKNSPEFSHIIKVRPAANDLNNFIAQPIFAFDERMETYSDATYYIDSLGDSHPVENGYVNGMKLTGAAPQKISQLPLYPQIAHPVSWLVSDDIIKGFDSSGRLSLFTDGANRVYRLTSAFGKFSRLTDIGGDNAIEVYSFEYSGDKLTAATNQLNGATVSFTYDSNGRMTKIHRTCGSTLDVSYDYVDGNLNQITSSDGIAVSFIKFGLDALYKSITVRSTLSAIPGGTSNAGAIIAQWKISPYATAYVVTDKDDNRDSFAFDVAGEEILYTREEHGLVAKAEKLTFIHGFAEQKVLPEKNCLYVPRAQFNFIDGQASYALLNAADKPVRSITKDVPIAESPSLGYSRQNLSSEYFYDADDRLTKIITTELLHLYSGSEKSYTHTEEYAYNSRGDMTQAVRHTQRKLYSARRRFGR